MDSFKIRLISINLTSYYYFYINLEFFPSKKKKKKKKIYLIFFAIILKLKQRTTKSRKSRNGKRRVATKKKKKCRFGEFVFFYFGCFKSYTDSKPIYRLKSIKTAKTTRYTPVSRAVQIRSVFVPVQVLTWKILAVPNSMERNCLPWCVG